MTNFETIYYTTSAVALLSLGIISFVIKSKPAKETGKDRMDYQECQITDYLDLRRRHAIIFGKATDHYGEVTVFSDYSFDLNTTIFVSAEGSLVYLIYILLAFFLIGPSTLSISDTSH